MVRLPHIQNRHSLVKAPKYRRAAALAHARALSARRPGSGFQEAARAWRREEALRVASEVAGTSAVDAAVSVALGHHLDDQRWGAAASGPSAFRPVNHVLSLQRKVQRMRLPEASFLVAVLRSYALRETILMKLLRGCHLSKIQARLDNRDDALLCVLRRVDAPARLR